MKKYHKKILLIPSFKETYKNQIEMCADVKLIKFLKKINKHSDIQIANSISKRQFDVLILSGGNDILKHSKKKKDILRSKFDNFYFNLAKKKKKLIIGICHGAIFLASKFNSRIIKTKHHVKNHYIFNNEHQIKVNSFHNYKIINLNKRLQTEYLAMDGSIESFVKKNKIYGTMWHPERYKLFRKLDILKFKKLLCN